MRRLAAILPAIVLTLLLTAPAQANNFGRLFPGLPPLTGPTNQQIADLAQTQLDPNLDAGNNPTMLSGFTYLGQKIDHDITGDPCCPVPLDPVDPTTISNTRTLRFDLDDVYGNPDAFAADRVHLLVQEDNGNGVRDLPRRPDGSAIIGDGRNDENEIISQLHVGFLELHNAVVDGMPQCRTPANRSVGRECLRRAQAEVRHLYQWIVLHQFLPHIVGQDVVDSFLDGRKRVRCVLFCSASFTPVEVSVAVYRFGHSMVRLAYEVNETTGKIQVFSFTQPDLRGGRPLPAGRQIAWGNFLPELTEPGDEADVNVSRRIDTLLSRSLFQLPIPGAEAAGSNVLGFRNMLRSQSYGLPSYESVATAMGLTPVDTGVRSMPGFADGTPLWYGILAESSQLEDGVRLGPVGARIVAEVFLRILKDDPSSILNVGFNPRVPGQEGDLTLDDLLVFAGVAERP
jgi:hypothetical protein